MKKENDRWCLWIDEKSKVIFVRKTLNLKSFSFDDKETWLKTVVSFVAMGYKVG